MASALCSCYEEKKLSKQRKRIRGGSGGFFFFFIGIVKDSQKGRKKLENNTMGLLLQPTAQNIFFVCLHVQYPLPWPLLVPVPQRPFLEASVVYLGALPLGCLTYDPVCHRVLQLHPCEEPSHLTAPMAVVLSSMSLGPALSSCLSFVRCVQTIHSVSSGGLKMGDPERRLFLEVLQSYNTVAEMPSFPRDKGEMLSDSWK